MTLPLIGMFSLSAGVLCLLVATPLWLLSLWMPLELAIPAWAVCLSTLCVRAGLFHQRHMPT